MEQLRELTNEEKFSFIEEALDNYTTIKENKGELNEQFVRMKGTDGSLRYRYSNSFISFETDLETMFKLISKNTCDFQGINITEVK